MTAMTDLPGSLAERVRVVGENTACLRPEGHFVLYWMHHAVRDHENPALDVASVVADDLSLPLLVYQGLGGSHRFNSDRHYTFIMEGARDVGAGLAERGIRYTFCLPAQENRSALLKLAQSAALVITEDLPVPPIAQWTNALAKRIPVPVWCVDTSCIVPMQCAPRRFDRAYEFRRAMRAQYEHRCDQTYDTADVTPEHYRGPLPFAETVLDDIDIGELCSALPIDHSIGPAPDTVGGMNAGYARWERFLSEGLGRYDRNRNDAERWPSAVSRMSPYLHHGHVSPFKAARDASRQRSRGAEKFLDELMIWRELAHNFCFFTDPRALETFHALPEWAKDSLARHAGDVREAIFDWETLARAKTGDPLWDAAQRSLNVHGELHNNVRMTWGKAIACWAKDPQRALDLMIDLNHRFALDGSDPASYGGLLWCLGLFDRPFKPERPVLGTVRSRPTIAHAKRLDIAKYEQVTARRRGMPVPRVAVIGAGISGLAAARTLVDNGLAVTVFDRGSRVGGRASSRIHESGDTFDYGAPCFSVTDPRFATFVAAWESQGIVKNWLGPTQIARKEADGHFSTRSVETEGYIVGAPSMNHLAQHLAANLEVHHRAEVKRLRRQSGYWQVGGDRLRHDALFDYVVLAMPSEQAKRLVKDDCLVHRRLEGVASRAQWVAMIRHVTSLSLQARRVEFVGHPVIAAACIEDSKPGRRSEGCVVVHARLDWSESRVEREPTSIATELADGWQQFLPEAPELIDVRAHRWKFARAADRAGRRVDAGYIWDPDQALALCGDWCGTGTLEDAFLAGVAVAARLLEADRRRSLNSAVIEQP
jgi:photolyase PhrII